MIPFTTEDLQKKPAEILCKGRWANADLFLYQAGGRSWIIKDFSPCPALVKKTYGSFMVRREFRALERLQGIQGIPEAPFQLHPFALSYQFIPGTTLKESRRQQQISPEYFIQLETLVKQMHARNIVHLDIRYMRNILLCDNGSPALLDFQTSLALDRIPRMFHRLLKTIDISGVYKCWQKICPDTMGPERKALLDAVEKRRSLWIFKGYPMGTRLSRR